MILNALVEKLKRRSKDDFKGRHYEATLILQAVSWYLRYPLSYRDIEELFLERGLEVDHSTLNRWVLAYAPLIERRLRAFRKPHCGSIRVDETYIKIRGQWRYLYRAIDKHGTPVDFLLTAKRDLEAAKRFFRKMLQERLANSFTAHLRQYEEVFKIKSRLATPSGVVVEEKCKPSGLPVPLGNHTAVLWMWAKAVAQEVLLGRDHCVRLTLICGQPANEIEHDRDI